MMLCQPQLASLWPSSCAFSMVMKGFHERTFDSNHCCKTYSDSPNRTSGSVCSEPGSSDSFAAIGDSKYTSSVNWGCMLRSSRMLVAQPLNKEYIEILHLFGDSEASTLSIHNLLQAGNSYDLAAGSWVGPYAMCRTWESLIRFKREESELEDQSFPVAIYVVSGDEDGKRGGALVVCVEDASRHCFEFSKGQANWTPILLLVPLVLGLDKINPRYIPFLSATFMFPQSLGILGGRPGASTYIVGVEDEEAFYLDPHEVQPIQCNIAFPH
ncbi:hypothetical protein HYC85_000455 [Camellia sinensis]|uniref:Cysteine protease n=1 Tax=Camellia sinensis TaxID=4442 RepID=A0A7J7I444_CAMSI|nr:hypothetical protein HYC85_000455 [Camellia sinensis]